MSGGVHGRPLAARLNAAQRCRWIGLLALVAAGALLVTRTMTRHTGALLLRPAAIASAPGEAEVGEFAIGDDASHEMPFRVRLVRTSADWEQELVVHTAGDDGAADLETATPLGLPFDEAVPAVRAPGTPTVQVLRFFRRATVDPEALTFAAAPGSAVAAVYLEVPGAAGTTSTQPAAAQHESATRSRWITDDGRGSPPLALPGAVLRFLSARTDTDAEAWLAPLGRPGAGEVGFLAVELPTGETLRPPATRGEEVEVAFDDVRFLLRIVDATVDLPGYLEARRAGNPRTPLEREVPQSAAVLVEVRAAGADGALGEPHTAWAFGGEEYREQGSSDPKFSSPALAEAGVRLYLDAQDHRAARLVEFPDGRLVYVEETAGRVTEPAEVEPGEQLPLLIEPGRLLRLGKHLPEAALDFPVTAVPDQGDAAYLLGGLEGQGAPPGRPAAQLRLTSASGEAQTVWVIGADPGGSGTVVPLMSGRYLLSLRSRAGVYAGVRAAVQAVTAGGAILAERVLDARTQAATAQGGGASAELVADDALRLRSYDCRIARFVGPHETGGPLVSLRVEHDPLWPWVLGVGGLSIVALLASRLLRPRR